MDSELRDQPMPINDRDDPVGPELAESAAPGSPINAVPGADANQYPSEENVLLAYASETGFIDDIAEIIRCDLESAGLSVRLAELGELDIPTLARETPILFMTSTTGAGDPPFAAEPFCDEIMAKPADLSHLRFGLLCAGDLSYENFCGFGHRLRDWLWASGARALFEPIDVDCEDDETVEQWRRYIRQVFSTAHRYGS